MQNKFRAYRPVFGDDECPVMTKPFTMGNLQDQHDFNFTDGGYVSWNEFGLEHEDCIIMQFTGLKDKNGVEIYEGDILKFKWLYQDYSVYIEDKWLYGKVEFVGGKFIVRRYCSTFDIGDINQMTFERFWRESYSSAKNEYFKMIGFEVVSNIHENPGLLGESL